MPEYDVTVTIITRKTYQTSIKAKDEETAEEKIRERTEKLIGEGKSIPWDLEEEEEGIEDVQVS